MSKSKINKIELTSFEIELIDIEENKSGIGIFYSPNSKKKHIRFGIRIFDTDGHIGEYVPPRSRAKVIMAASEALSYHIIGKNPLHREAIYRQLRGLCKHIGEVGIGAIDIALWDLAGKKHGCSISDLLGGYRELLPSYASTMHGDREKNGLSSPEAYADFAEECLELGYKGYKMHGWNKGNVKEEIEMLKAVGERVGDKMKIMYDAGCHLNTLADALEVGKVCDEYNFYWYEDPYKDGGVSINGNKALVSGNTKFEPAELMATDLRASVSLVLAALSAKGKSIINRIYHLDRGYEFLEKKLKSCKAEIRRV